MFKTLSKRSGLLVCAVFATATALHAQGVADVEEPSDTTQAAPFDPTEGLIGRLSGRLAYNTERGAVIGLAYTTDRFLGRDQSLRFATELSEDDTRINLTFTNDNLFGSEPAFGLHLYHSDRRASDAFGFDTVSTGIEPSLTWMLASGLRVTPYLAFSHDDISGLTAGTDSALLVADQGDRTRRAAGVRLAYRLPMGDSGPFENMRFNLSQEFGATSDDTDYSKTTLGIAMAGQSASGAVAYGISLRGGALNMTNGNSNIGDRFLLGQGSVRGFAFGGMGPRDLAAGNAALGGNRFAAARFDVQFPGAFGESRIVPGLFYDVGSLWGLDSVAGGPAGANPVDDSQHWRSSVGLSIQIGTGVGPIRINIAHPLQEEAYDVNEVFQLTFQTSF